MDSAFCDYTACKKPGRYLQFNLPIMPGKLITNLRSGHKAEDLGVAFLRNFCAVAQIRQEDDIGIDAVSTLLHREGKFLYAENSFFVQVKSESVEEITYASDEIDWFVNQDLPFFICTVDKKNDVIKIFTTNAAYCIIAYRGYKKLRLNLTDGPHGFMERIDFDGDTAIVDIGPPIIISGLRISEDETEQENLYKIMTSWVTEEHQQTQLRKLGFSMIASWDTGTPPTYYGKVVNGNSINIERDLLAAKPFLEYLSNHLEWDVQSEEYKKEIMRGLKKWYKEFDIDIGLNVDKKFIRKDNSREIYTE